MAVSATAVFKTLGKAHEQRLHAGIYIGTVIEAAGLPYKRHSQDRKSVV